MSLTDIEAVRLKAADQSVITREESLGDAVSVYFKLGHHPVLDTPTLQVRKDNVLLTVNVDYTVDLVNGIVTFTAAPALGATLEFVYYWSIFTDEQIQYFLDAASSDVTIATAQVLLAIAADASKIAKRESMAGGGGLGAVTIDTSVAARELRNTAQALIDTVKQVDNLEPSEGLTEPVWTEFNYRDMLGQRIIRNS